MTLRRSTHIPRSRGTGIPREVRFDVLARDGYQCVGKQLGWASHPETLYAESALEIDHVRASGGLGIKSPSTADNLVSLCGACHRWKTEHGREARPILLSYLGGVGA